MQALRNYTESYQYDPVGNIMAMIHSVQNGGWKRAYDYESSSNRLRGTSLPGDAEETFSAKYAYDEHGNMTQMPHLPLMQWDFKDQLQATSQQVRNDGGTPEITYFVYDASGQRVRKVTERQADAGQTPKRKSERIYLGGFELYREYNGDGTTTLERETLHIMDDQRRIALVETKTQDTENPVATPQPIIRYQLDNHLGSASLELDKDGNVISYEEYHPYGTTSYQAQSSVAEVSLKRYRYTGKERDEETGLAHHGARYYAPWLGRWTSSDPIGINGGLNTFSYVRNRPVNAIDVNGMDGKDMTDELNQKYLGIKPSSEAPFIDLTPKTSAGRELDRRAKDPSDTFGLSVPKPFKAPPVIDPRCKPLFNQQKPAQQSEARQESPGDPTLEEFNREGVANLNLLLSGGLTKDPIATVLSAPTLLRDHDAIELTEQLHRAEGASGLLKAAASLSNRASGEPVPDARQKQSGAPVDNTPVVAPAPAATPAAPAQQSQFVLFSRSKAEADAFRRTVSQIEGLEPPPTPGLGGPKANGNIGKWGSNFSNRPLQPGREPELPSALSPFKEYTSLMPGAQNRGSLRIVSGDGGQALFNTWTHYGDAQPFFPLDPTVPLTRVTFLRFR